MLSIIVFKLEVRHMVKQMDKDFYLGQSLQEFDRRIRFDEQFGTRT